MHSSYSNEHHWRRARALFGLFDKDYKADGDKFWDGYENYLTEMKGSTLMRKKYECLYQRSNETYSILYVSVYFALRV